MSDAALRKRIRTILQKQIDGGIVVGGRKAKGVRHCVEYEPVMLKSGKASKRCQKYASGSGCMMCPSCMGEGIVVGGTPVGGLNLAPLRNKLIREKGRKDWKIFLADYIIKHPELAMGSKADLHRMASRAFVESSLPKGGAKCAQLKNLITGRKQSSPWLEFVARYALAHPELASDRPALLKAASAEYHKLPQKKKSIEQALEEMSF